MMPASNLAIRIASAAVALAFLDPASAQQLFQPTRPSPAVRPAPVAAPKAPAAPSARAASCHNGASFAQFLAELKQQAVAQGVSQRAISEASPYLTYDQGIVN